MRKLKIGIQGIEASFHDLVAHQYFGENIETIPCASFGLLCEKLATGDVDYSVMAIENSLSGSLLTNYRLLQDHHLKIIGEVYLPIQQNLLVLPGVKMEDIEEVLSHPIALRQCTEYLAQHPNWKLLERNDTAECAKVIAEQGNRKAAAIAGAYAAERYGLQVLERSIESNKKNYTRFMILSTMADNHPDHNKATISLRLGHQVGSLASILDVFRDHHINLTKIQSVPVIGHPNEYTFHVDVEWSDYSNYEAAMHLVLKHASHLSVLGEYKKGNLEQLLNTTTDEARFEHSTY
ncbi:MAG: prephenate dehydratase [Flavobacteriales bacterium]|nr:prephenate dehydratase [Flavobacteriales bacterium]MCB9449346.1 prephenate dehydratase [Flavobacteriales bacterium]